MNKRHFQQYFIVILSFIISGPLYAASLTINEVTEKILSYYPDIKIAAREVQRARHEISKVESQLGWTQSTRVGLVHDVSLFASPVDQLEGNLNFNRQYSNGDSVNITGAYRYEDAATSFSPSLPNPSHTMRVEMEYRMPLERGDLNPAYTQQNVLAAESEIVALQNKRLLINNLTYQTIDLYFDFYSTLVRIDDANKSIKRARRLMRFVVDNQSLGLSSQEDVLRIDAQIKRQISLRDSLLILRETQRLELNRLMGMPANFEFTPVVNDVESISSIKDSLNLAYDYSPELSLARSELTLKKSNTMLSLDKKKEQLDIVISGGVFFNEGEVAGNNINDDEFVGAVYLEYKFNHDQRGFDAELYQTKIDEVIAEEKINRIKIDLEYDLARLFSQINAGETALGSSRQYYRSEQKKYDAAYKRYHEGRENISDLIDYENSVQASYLNYKSAEIELARNNSKFSLITGNLWNESLVSYKNKFELNGAAQ